MDPNQPEPTPPKCEECEFYRRSKTITGQYFAWCLRKAGVCITPHIQRNSRLKVDCGHAGRHFKAKGMK